MKQVLELNESKYSVKETHVFLQEVCHIGETLP